MIIKKPKEKIKMLQVPISETEYNNLKAKAEKEKRTLPNQVKLILDIFSDEDMTELSWCLTYFLSPIFTSVARFGLCSIQF